MANPDGQVVFEVSADNKKLKQTLSETTNVIQKESKNWDDAVDQSSKNMQSAMTRALDINRVKDWALKAGKAILDFSAECIGAASNLAEVQNVVDTTFGESAAEIDRWAKDAINQFGLTETQAKKFASTMGAMMKSSGVASKDITEMSETLAGLAADMSSFYNLDFEEAFNKIRSGISGETEPLKQLGINMSVANLEAFALSQGLKKTFNEMSQGEQIMLRYQYLMQATSDAQGDFARTSDGFANGLRLLQSNFEQLKTTIGSLLLPVVSQAISGLNDMLGLLIPETKQRTVLDDFADINLKKEQKLKEIEAVANEANDLVSVLQKIESANIVDSSGTIGNIAGGANKLSSDAGTNWENFLNGLDGVSTAITATAGGVVAGINLSGLAKGAKDLTGTPETQFKYQNLPPKIQELLNKANQAGTVKSGLTTIDDEAGKLTKDEQTKFKFGKLITDLGDLETKTGEAATDVPNEVNKLDAGMSDITTDDNSYGFKFSKYEDDIAGLETKTGEAANGVETEVGNLDSAMKDITTEDNTTGFKYTKYEGDVSELETKTGDAATGVEQEIKNLDSKMADITTDDNTTGFKFSKYEQDAEGLVTKTGEVATGVAEEVGNIDSAMKDITTDNNNTGFKFGKYESDVEGLVTKTEEAANGVETEIGNIDKATADITTAQDTDFKYDDLKSDVKSLNDEMATAATDLQGNASAVKNAAEGMVGKIRMLDSTSRNNWVSVLNVFKNIPGYANKINTETITGIASAFAGLEGDKAAAWKTLMDALGSDLTALSTLTGKDEQGAAAWLEDMKEAANGLDNGSTAEWNALFSLLANGAPGAGNFVTPEDMARLAQAAGMSTQTVKKLGDSSISVADKQKEWIATCKRLVQILPGLSSIINTETGEINGGVQAVADYVEAWKKGQKELIYWKAHFDKEAALLNDTGIMDADLEVMRAEAKIARLQKASDAWEKERENNSKKWVSDWEKEKKRIETETDSLLSSTEYADHIKKKNPYENQQNPFLQELAEAGAEVEKAYNQRTIAANAYAAGLQEVQDEEAGLIATLGEESKEIAKVNQGLSEGTGNLDKYSAEAKEAKEGVETLTDALKDMNDYIDRTRKSTEDSIDSTLKGFKSFEKGYDYIHNLKTKVQSEETDWLQKEQDNYDKAQKKNEQYVKKTFTGWDEVPNMDKMSKALQSQTAFLTEYNDNLIQLKEWGLTDEFLAQFADMSQENAGYLYLMVEAGKDAALGLNEDFKKMSEAKKPLVDSLTELKLNTDDEFQEQVKKVQEAAEKLDQSEIAKDSMAKTIEGIAAGISEHVSDVKEAVTALNNELARLGQVQDLNIFDGLNGGGFSFTFTGSGPDSNAKGLDYVPYDNYLSYLHEGEAVLTAEEARVWRNFVNGGANIANTIDYAQLSGAIWDNAPHMGGNVYLDGATVGRVISAQQANSIRTLERSGWQG